MARVLQRTRAGCVRLAGAIVPPTAPAGDYELRVADVTAQAPGVPPPRCSWAARVLMLSADGDAPAASGSKGKKGKKGNKKK